MKWEVVIGLEAHAQLTTRSKIFSGAGTTFGASANSQACGVDIALPGTLPVLNQDAVRNAIKFGLSVGANIAPRSVFARKNYFYPDLPKGYQISQYELPVVQGGSLTVQVGEHSKTVRLTRAHLEEDAGKSLHEDFHGMTGIDLNRAGTPLLEIVTEPDMRSAAEAVAYAKALHGLLRWIEVCDGNMQEGSFRCDANVSVRPLGQEVYGTRCEIKNLNSFRFLEKAIDYEVRRQIELIEDGGKVVQETRLYDPDQDETRSMRSKEDAQDYRYFPDPDLLPLVIDADWIEQVRMSMPELPASKRARYISELGLSEYDAGVLTTSLELSAYFESAIKHLPGQAKLCANWIMVDLLGRLNREELEIGQSPVSAERMAGLVRRVADGTVSGKMAKEIFEALWQGEGDADQIIERRGLRQISDTGALEDMVDQIIAANPAQVAEFRSGKDKAFNFLVGQAMKASKGKANPAQLNEILKRRLA